MILTSADLVQSKKTLTYKITRVSFYLMSLVQLKKKISYSVKERVFFHLMFLIDVL